VLHSDIGVKETFSIPWERKTRISFKETEAVGKFGGSEREREKLYIYTYSSLSVGSVSDSGQYLGSTYGS